MPFKGRNPEKQQRAMFAKDINNLENAGFRIKTKKLNNATQTPITIPKDGTYIRVVGTKERGNREVRFLKRDKAQAYAQQLQNKGYNVTTSIIR